LIYRFAHANRFFDQLPTITLGVLEDINEYDQNLAEPDTGMDIEPWILR